MSTEQPRTLTELASRRREQHRPIDVHVVGDFRMKPPIGSDVAQNVAELLVKGGGTVRDSDYDDLEEGDVALIEIDPDLRLGKDARDKYEEIATRSRLNELAGTVVLSEGLGPRIERFMDARVWAESGEVERVGQLHVHPYNDKMHIEDTYRLSR